MSETRSRIVRERKQRWPQFDFGIVCRQRQAERVFAVKSARKMTYRTTDVQKTNIKSGQKRILPGVAAGCQGQAVVCYQPAVLTGRISATSTSELLRLCLCILKKREISEMRFMLWCVAPPRDKVLTRRPRDQRPIVVRFPDDITKFISPALF